MLRSSPLFKKQDNLLLEDASTRRRMSLKTWKLRSISWVTRKKSSSRPFSSSILSPALRAELLARYVIWTFHILSPLLLLKVKVLSIHKHKSAQQPRSSAVFSASRWIVLFLIPYVLSAFEKELRRKMTLIETTMITTSWTDWTIQFSTQTGLQLMNSSF